jgi:hypothetical protein
MARKQPEPAYLLMLLRVCGRCGAEMGYQDEQPLGAKLCSSSSAKSVQGPGRGSLFKGREDGDQ